MMNAEEQEYMDYLIHNRTQLTNQITRHLDRIDLLEKKLDIAVSALQYYAEGTLGSSVAEQALKEIDLLGTSVFLADNKIQANTLADNKLQAKEEE